MSEQPFKLKTYLLVPLGNWLNTLALPGRESRSRRRFVDLLRVGVDDSEKSRIELLKEHAKKDDKGEPIMKKDEQGVERYDLVDEDKFKEEYAALMNEEFIIDASAANLPTLLQASSIVLNTSEVFKDTPENPMAAYYDEWCKAFEAMDPESAK